MALIKEFLFNKLVEFDNNLTVDSGSNASKRKFDLMTTINEYGKKVIPSSISSESAKLDGYYAFTGDNPKVFYSFAKALSHAMEAYAKTLAIGMIGYTPVYMPTWNILYVNLLKIKSTEDRYSQVRILATEIDKWMKLHISMNTVTKVTKNWS
jgi:hypothetical protein